jgi:hypothetical protein
MTVRLQLINNTKILKQYKCHFVIIVTHSEKGVLSFNAQVKTKKMNLPSCRDGLENGNGGIVKVHLNPEVVDRHQNAFPFDHLKQLDEKNP